MIRGSVFAADYYFDFTNGLDTNDGLTPETAFQTIGQATAIINAGAGGDTLLFKCGETWDIPQDGSGININKDNINIGSYGTGNRPVITCAGNVGDGIRGNSAVNVCIRIEPYLDTISVDGVYCHAAQDEYAIDGANDDTPNVTINNCVLYGDGWSAEGLIKLLGDNATVTNCFFDGGGNNYSKLLEISRSNSVLVRGNTFLQGASLGGALRMVDCGEASLVEKNYFSGISPGQSNNIQAVLRSLQGGGTDNYLIFQNNFVSWHDSVLTADDGANGVRSFLNDADTVLYILNNTFVGNTHGTSLRLETTNATFYNNITVNADAVLDVTNAGVTVTQGNSAYYGTPLLNTVNDGTVIDNGNNVTTDPLLISTTPVTVDDFKVSTGSPCISAGLNTGLSVPFPTDDYYGTARPTPPTLMTIGGYEFVSATIPAIDVGADDVTTNATYNITGTATATAGRTISNVTLPGYTVIPDNGAWDEQVESFSVLVNLSLGANVFNFTAIDSEAEEGYDSKTITRNAVIVSGSIAKGCVIKGATIK